MPEMLTTMLQILGWIVVIPLIGLAFWGLRRGRTAAMRRDIEERAKIHRRPK